jgi:UDP-N-acetyl-D-galactosamine dehydrogenase
VNENAQRDINIAFMNEITQIFSKLDISIWDVPRGRGTSGISCPVQPVSVGGPASASDL